MSVTLRDVAAHTGLSPSTVSGVLNNRKGTWASAETRRRIEEAALTLGYRPHHAARALRTGKTNVVSVLYHIGAPLQHLTFDGFAEIMAAGLGSHGYELKLKVYSDQRDLLSGLSDLIHRQSCDAVVLVGREADVVEQGQLLESHRIPFIVKGRHERQFPNWYQVDYDHEGMMLAAVRHCVAGGHRRIAYIGYKPHEAYQHHLLAGFKQAIQETFGSEPAPDAIALLDPISRPITTDFVNDWFRLPLAEQPSAFVIGTGSRDWLEVERLLALQGRYLGDGPGEVGIAGQASHDIPLIYGKGWRFVDVSYGPIAQTGVTDLLLPLLRGEDISQPVRRILPDLVPIDTLGFARR